MLDILIVDTENDLNVYVNVAKESQTSNDHIPDCCELVAKGCGFSTQQSGDCCKEQTAGDCYLNRGNDTVNRSNGSSNSTTPMNKSSTGCCSATCSGNQDSEGLELHLCDIDVNEWAGKLSLMTQILLC
jgi:hypothetical protein